MQAFLPDKLLREEWRAMAQNERRGQRAEFWKSLPALPERPEDGHKGTFGTALLIGGSYGMSGAIALAGAACLRSGAGLTRLAVPSVILDVVASFQREYTTLAMPSDGGGTIARDADLLALTKSAHAVAVGPGMGRSAGLDALVPEFFTQLDKPLVVDADALNALASAGIFTCASDAADAPCGARILTPHPGEFARLTGAKPSADAQGRIDAVKAFLDKALKRYDGALKADLVVALKGHETVVGRIEAQTQNIEIAVNKTGNANLATGGSGDVLTGVIVGLLAQKASAFDACRIGVALHGLAAELRSTLCTRGAIASDIVAFLPVAFDYYLEACE